VATLAESGRRAVVRAFDIQRTVEKCGVLPHRLGRVQVKVRAGVAAHPEG